MHVSTDDGAELVLDAGSGIRGLGEALVGCGRRIDILRRTYTSITSAA